MLDKVDLFAGLVDVEKLLKSNDIARMLNVSRSFAYLLMKSGDLPTVRLGRSVRVRPDDLWNYIEKNTIGGDGKYR